MPDTVDQKRGKIIKRSDYISSIRFIIAGTDIVIVGTFIKIGERVPVDHAWRLPVQRSKSNSGVPFAENIVKPAYDFNLENCGDAFSFF